MSSGNKWLFLSGCGLRHAMLPLLILAAAQSRGSGDQPQRIAGEVLFMLWHNEDSARVIECLSTQYGLPVELRCISQRLKVWLGRGVVGSEHQLHDALNRCPQVRLVQYHHMASVRSMPNDPLFAQQWNLHNVGQTGGTVGADVRATHAWDLTTGGLTALGDSVVIAIVDDGFDLAHVDLWFWKNWMEIPNNGIDDDQNGYVDDFDGWNSISNSGTLPVSNHGTEMCGIAAARGNNGLGITGINWNTKILPVKGVGTEAQVVAAYSYVLEQRIRYNQTQGSEGAFVVVCNSSFGINNGKPENFPIWCAMYDTMGQYGILNVAATTNSMVNVDVVGDIPTTCPSPYLISVTNTNHADQLGGGYGLENIDLAAPGTGVLTTFSFNTYNTANGTSPSAPHVSGAIALLYSLACHTLAEAARTQPSQTALTVRQLVLAGVDTLPQLADKVASGGRLNIYNTLLKAIEHFQCQLGFSNLGSTSDQLFLFPNPGSDWLTVRTGQPSADHLQIELFDLSQRLLLEHRFPVDVLATLNVAHLPPGPYLVKVIAGGRVISALWVKY